MELLLLGTAAAEGWPAPFCDCAACQGARRHGGRDVRTRSGALLDRVVKVDYGPDTVMQMQRAGRDLLEVTTLIFTHGHDDHFTPTELQYRGAGFVPNTDLPTLSVYGNAEVMDRLAVQFPSPAAQRMAFEKPLTPLRPVMTPDGMEILPLPADHAPGALLLRLTRGGKRILYGHDSGLYPDEAIAALAGTPLDAVLFDCTYGGAPTQNRGHMGIEGVRQMAAQLRAVGAATPDTQLIATHFSHNGGLRHDDLVARLAPDGVRVSYDGLLLDL